MSSKLSRIFACSILAVVFGCSIENSAPSSPTPSLAEGVARPQRIIKNNRFVFDPKVAKASAVTRPIEIEADRLFAEGHYAEALSRYEAVQKVWRAIETPRFGIGDQIVECLYRLGRDQEVVQAAPRERIHSLATKIAVAISQYKLGDAASADGILRQRHFVTYLTKDLEKHLPNLKDAKGVEANVRMARGIELFFKGQTSDADAEFSSSVRLGPENVVANHFAFLTSLALGHENAALRYSHLAAKVAGPFGDRARQYEECFRPPPRKI